MKKHPLSLLARVCFSTLLLVAGSACGEAPRVDTNPAQPPVPLAAPVAMPASPAASAPGTARTPASTATPAAALSQQIDAEIGNAACDTSQQCRSLPVGSKPCGGPAGYKAWSSKANDGTRLTALAAQQAADQKKADTASGRMSTCSFAADPGASCVAGRCVLNKAGPSAQ